ncbi:MAG: AAA family ATPase [Phycisphaerae bacterium]|nr:AAA family ATPase [Phycisphaerae bacterium]
MPHTDSPEHGISAGHPDAIARTEALLRELREAVATRAAEEKACADAAKSDRAKNEKLHDLTMSTIRQRRSDERRAEDERFTTRTTAIADGYGRDREAIDEEDRSTRESIETRVEANLDAAKAKRDEAIWVAETVYEGAEDQPRIAFEKARESATVQRQELDELEKQARLFARRCRQTLPEPPAPAQDRLTSGATRAEAGLTMALGMAQEQLRVLRGLKLPRAFVGGIPFIVLAIFGGAGVGVGYAISPGSSASMWMAMSVGVALFLVVAAVLWSLAHGHIKRSWLPLAETIAVGRHCAIVAIEQAAKERADLELRLKETRDRDVLEANARYGPLAEEFARLKADRFAKLAEKIPAMRRELEARRTKDIADNDLFHRQRIEEIERISAESLVAEEARVTREREAITNREATRFAALERSWHAVTSRDLAALEAIASADRTLFPSWNDAAWRSWSGSAVIPDAIRFGSVHFDLAACEGGLSTNPHLTVHLPTSIDVPASLAFPHRSSLLVETDGDGRNQAIELVQSVLLRLLTRVPPSKVRLVLVDPVGLGQSFAGFMHLADEMEALVGDRIWTEPRHIEQKLTDLTEHMETVIQKYLRNEFDSIEAYNEKAGEIAEPLRYLVITDFPANFTDIAAKRLQSILASGAKCGVHTLIVRTGKGELPAGITNEDLRRGSVVLTKTADGSAAGSLTISGDELSRWPFTPDPAPPTELLIPLVRQVGKAAKEAGRVEVPFSIIAPREATPGSTDGEQWWSETSEKRVRVPLGRSGATKLQHLILGEGTSQHALIAGKTGSGKSTLLHALITSLACWYSPDEVEFYLIDFKKGVEFRTYAHHKLPHARAVAIESDREFGLSVLQGLDVELKRRGDLFRDLGVQDLNGYRRVRREKPALEPMPRTLLIIDEFQELFVEDDKVGQDAALLLDRLVRQGRAFGMHVILGSQTLGGAYSIARATMGQMGVRIALQCSEADSQLILSDDNSAARLLSRPGEAIYNDASGLLEGNSPFQVVWLPEEVRERYLERAARLAVERKPRSRGTIVFEGNIPADQLANKTINDRLDAPTWNDPQRPTLLWLGDAIAIKPPTAATFRRQAAANLMVVGQQDIGSTALMAMTMMSIAMQRSPADARIVLLDGTPADDPKVGLLAKVAEHLPHDIKVVPYREVDDAVRGVAEEVVARQGGGDDRQSVFLLIHGLQRFRQLRRNEDDYGFGTSEGPAPTDKLFASILREGASLGVHVILTCDTVASLQRSVDRAGMREFDWRAMFQLSQTDSSTLIDSPAAARLGPQRALLYSEELGTIEKFRPWLLPTEEFLERVRGALAARASVV